MTNKDTLRFQDPIQVYTRRTTTLMCHSQPQYQVLCKNQVRLSSLNYLVIILLMIFSLHFEKQTYLYSISSFQFHFLFSFIIFLSFIYFFFKLILDSQECFKSTVYPTLDSGDVRRDNGLRA